MQNVLKKAFLRSLHAKYFQKLQKLAALLLFPSITVLLFTFIFAGQLHFLCFNPAMNLHVWSMIGCKILTFGEHVCMINWKAKLRLENCRTVFFIVGMHAVIRFLPFVAVVFCCGANTFRRIIRVVLLKSQPLGKLH